MSDLKQLMDGAVAGLRPSPVSRLMPFESTGGGRDRRIAAGIVSAAAVIAAALLWSVGSSSDSGDSRLVPVTGTTTPSGPPRYVATGSVISDPREGQAPRLCVSAIAQSLPPGCSGIPLRGVDINTLPGVQTYAGVTWTEKLLRFVGSYSGGVLTVTERPTLAPPPASLREPDSVDLPCAPPAGGWTSRKFDPSDAAVLSAYGAAHPDTFGGFWTTHNQQVGVATTTGDVATARRDIRRTYSGNLCVTKAEYTDKYLRAASTRLGTAMTPKNPLGISTTIDNSYESRIDIWVTIENKAVRDYLAANFPADLIRVHAYLVPLK